MENKYNPIIIRATASSTEHSDKYRVILNYCWGFHGLYFSDGKERNKPACGI
jgi:hypothetical protein